VFIDADATDADGDNLVYSCNRTDLFTDFDTTNGKGNWTTQSGDAGTYYIDFGVSDGYGGIDNLTVRITVNSITPTNFPIASFTYSPENPVVNQTIIFKALQGEEITNYTWEFDGSYGKSIEVEIHTLMQERIWSISPLVTKILLRQYHSPTIYDRVILTFVPPTPENNSVTNVTSLNISITSNKPLEFSTLLWSQMRQCLEQTISGILKSVVLQMEFMNSGSMQMVQYRRQEESELTHSPLR